MHKCRWTQHTANTHLLQKGNEIEPLLFCIFKRRGLFLASSCKKYPPLRLWAKFSFRVYVVCQKQSSLCEVNYPLQHPVSASFFSSLQFAIGKTKYIFFFFTAGNGEQHKEHWLFPCIKQERRGCCHFTRPFCGWEVCCSSTLHPCPPHKHEGRLPRPLGSCWPVGSSKHSVVYLREPAAGGPHCH